MLTNPTPREALAILREHIEEHPDPHAIAGTHARNIAALDVVERALEAAAKEAECWAVIERWQLHPRKHAQYTLGVGRHVILLTTTDAYYNRTGREFAGSRLEALQLAAQWVKEQEQHG